MFTPDLSVIPAEAGTHRLVDLDSRLRGNDKGVGFIQTYKGIFVATTFGYNQHVVMLNLFQHPQINLEIPKQVRNDMERSFIFVAMTDRAAHLSSRGLS